MRLLLLRHGKSARPAEVDDFDRPLCDRGRRDAPAIGTWMQAHGIQPELVLCSPARRARETLELMLPLIGNPETRFDQALYLAGPSTLMRKIRSAPMLSPLMLVGHNPGLHELGLALIGQPDTGDPNSRQEEFTRKLPTSGLAVLDFARTTWRNVRAGSGVLTEFIRPKILTGTNSA